jgi:hypothetical protein
MSNTYKLNVNISIIFWSMVVVGLIALYMMKKKKQESGYLFLDGSYFINSPYVDSYPQY